NAQSMLAGAGQIAAGQRVLPAVRYSLIRTNLHPATIGALRVPRGPVAGKSLAVTLPIVSKPKALPDSGLQLAVRWDPMTVGPPTGPRPPRRMERPATTLIRSGSHRRSPARWSRPRSPASTVALFAPRSWCRAGRGSTD